jgi:hypothetical protein
MTLSRAAMFILFSCLCCVLCNAREDYELKFSKPDILKLEDGELLYDPSIYYGVEIDHMFRIEGKGVSASGRGYSYDLSCGGEKVFENILKIESLKDGESIEVPKEIIFKRVKDKVHVFVYRQPEFSAISGVPTAQIFDYKEGLIFVKKVRDRARWLDSTFNGKSRK